MIKLNFDIMSFCDFKPNWNKNYKEYKVSYVYPNDMILKDVLLELYNQYRIENGNIENYFIPHITELLWGRFFSKDVCYQIIDSYDSYLDLCLDDLEKQFEISHIVIPLFLDYDGIGRSIGDVEGVRIFFHLNEKDLHHNPHVHCFYSGDEVRIEIDSLKILDKPFKKSKMDVAIDFIKKNQDEMLNYWDKVVVNGQSIELNIEL